MRFNLGSLFRFLGSFLVNRFFAISILALSLPLPALAEHAAVPGEVLVEFAAEPVPARVKSTRLSTPRVVGAALQEHLSPDLRSARISVNPDLQAMAGVASISAEQDAKDACAALQLQNLGRIRYCSPNYILHATSTTPNDPSFSQLWGMSSASGIDAPKAWDTTTGSADEVVAVVDTGIDYTHPDLAANIWTNPGEIPDNGIDDDGNGYIDDVHGINAITDTGNPMDDNGHGTHVSGTIAGVGNNGLGVAGVNWHAKVVAAKFLSAGGSGTLADAIKAINYIVDLKLSGVNIHAINNSWGGGGFSAPLNSAISRANDAGLIFVAAAGNEANDNDNNPEYPSGYELPNVVAVAALDQDGNLASFSNYGATTVDIAAPGVGILSTIPGGGYAQYSGTSMATPHVTGALALLYSHEPSLSVSQALDRLYGSGKPLATLAGAVRTERMLNAGRLISGDTSPIPQPPTLPGCQYAVSTITSSPDTAADNARMIINADDGNYYTVRLPFQVAWDGGSVSSITVSPNGVVYMGSTPLGNDYLSGPVAPRNSIAALHADLYPMGQGYGVRVAVGSDSVTVNWRTTSYALKAGVAIVRLTIHANGVIQSWYEFHDQTLETSLSATATVGIHGATAQSIATFSAADGKVHDGLGVQFTPSCEDARVQVQELDLVGISNLGTSPQLELGKKLGMSVFGSGTGALTLQFAIEKRVCKEVVVKQVVEGQLHLTGNVPRSLGGARWVQVGVSGTSIKGRISVRKARTRNTTTRKLSRQEFSSACATLANSLR